MSIVVETFLNCDGYCGKNYGVDCRHLTGGQQRASAKKDGWKLIDGKDYCQECIKAGRHKKNKQWG